jgi:monofunctional biosynthetic peptidoglycan transglycosylase
VPLSPRLAAPDPRGARAEDQKFFGHDGVDWRAIQDSIEKNVEKGRFARGGSTITQQLAKNLYFGTARRRSASCASWS